MGARARRPAIASKTRRGRGRGRVKPYHTIPVSTAVILSGGSALLRVRNSASSRVKMSLVTTASDILSRSAEHSLSVSAVLPDPTGPPIPTLCRTREFTSCVQRARARRLAHTLERLQRRVCVCVCVCVVTRSFCCCNVRECAPRPVAGRGVRHVTLRVLARVV